MRTGKKVDNRQESPGQATTLKTGDKGRIGIIISKKLSMQKTGIEQRTVGKVEDRLES